MKRKKERKKEDSNLDTELFQIITDPLINVFNSI